MAQQDQVPQQRHRQEGSWMPECPYNAGDFRSRLQVVRNQHALHRDPPDRIHATCHLQHQLMMGNFHLDIPQLLKQKTPSTGHPDSHFPIPKSQIRNPDSDFRNPTSAFPFIRVSRQNLFGRNQEYNMTRLQTHTSLYRTDILQAVSRP